MNQATAKRSFDGALHLHTTFSYDGQVAVEELAHFLQAKGYDFMAITEHSQSLDSPAIEQLIEKCRNLSTEEFLIVPGIEFSCRGSIHIMGIGVTKLCQTDEPADVIAHIHRHEGLAILAHPTIKDYPLAPAWTDLLDGCEIWNVTNEGKLLPQVKSIKKYRELSETHTGLGAFCGLDLHNKESFQKVAAETFADKLDKTSIIAALRKGNFRTRSAIFNINSRADINPVYYTFIVVARKMLNCVRWIRGLWRK